MSAAIDLSPKRCACGCGAVLPYERRRDVKWAGKGCYQRHRARARNRQTRGYEPSASPVWRARYELLRALLAEHGPLPYRRLYELCRARHGWTAAVLVNVLAWGHPGVCERGGEWRID